MNTSGKNKTVLIIVLAVILIAVFFIAGLIVGLLAGSVGPDAFGSLSEITFGKDIYRSSCTMYVNRNQVPETSISSGDLSASQDIAAVLQTILESESVRSAISEEYPDIEYTLSIETINETNVFTIIVESENREYVDDICNLAGSILCEQLERVVVGTSCKFVDIATEPQTPIRKGFLG